MFNDHHSLSIRSTIDRTYSYYKIQLSLLTEHQFFDLCNQFHHVSDCTFKVVKELNDNVINNCLINQKFSLGIPKILFLGINSGSSTQVQ